MAISRVGSASAAATTLTLPAHAAGDLLIMEVFRDGSTTSPTVPSGWTLKKSQTTTSTFGAVYEKWAISSGETSGTWTSASALACKVYRKAWGIGASASQGAVSTAITCPALTREVTDGTSWIGRFFAHRSATNQNAIALTGYTQVTAISTELGSFDSNGEVGSNPTSTAGSPVANASSGWVGFTYEILAMPTVSFTLENVAKSPNCPMPENCTGVYTSVGGRGANGATGDSPSGSNNIRNGGPGGAGAGRIGRSWIPASYWGDYFNIQLASALGVDAVVSTEAGMVLTADSPTGQTAGTTSAVNAPGDIYVAQGTNGGNKGGTASAAGPGGAGVNNSDGAGAGGGGGGGGRDSTNGSGGAKGVSTGGDPEGDGDGWPGGNAITSRGGHGGAGGGGFDPATGQQTAAGPGRVKLEFVIEEPVPEGTASGTYQFSGSATGYRLPKGSVTALYTWVASAVGRSQRNSIASGTYNFAATVLGYSHRKGTASGTYTWDAEEVGDVDYRGSGSGTYTWEGEATGITPVSAPTGSGTYRWQGSAVGYSKRSATAAGTLSWAATATGKRSPRAVAEGAWQFVATAIGKRIMKGLGSGQYNFEGEAAGHRTNSAYSSGTYKWTALATGQHTPKPVPGQVGWYAE